MSQVNKKKVSIFFFVYKIKSIAWIGSVTTQANLKKTRNSMAVWIAEVLLRLCKDRLESHETAICQRVIKKQWASQLELNFLKRVEERLNPFDDEGPSVDD